MIFNLLYLIKKLFIKYLMLNLKENTILLTFSFYILILLLFSISINNLNLLKSLGFNLIYLTTILTFILSIDTIFQKDFEDGTLDLFNLTILPIHLLILFKIIIHWFNYGVPLIILSPLVLVIFNIYDNFYNMIYILIYASTYLSIWSVFFGTLVLGLNQKSLILIIIVLPIFIPIYIFSINIFNIEFIHIIIALNILLINLIINILLSNYIISILFKN